jgi:AcrR family transcriptional regulator
VRGVYLATQAAVRHMTDGGRVISIGSSFAERAPYPGVSLYAMSKSALLGMTRGLARDLGPRGITINVVQPGSTDTVVAVVTATVSFILLSWSLRNLPVGTAYAVWSALARSASPSPASLRLGRGSVTTATRLPRSHCGRNRRAQGRRGLTHALKAKGHTNGARRMATRGRPRTFDRRIALDKAMRLFWERGYEGTSLADLTSTIGIGAPSLYAAFGSKETLYREAVTHYNAVHGAVPAQMLDDARTAREGIEALLQHNARAYVAPDHPKGCMVLAGATGAVENAHIHRFLAACRADDLAALHRRIARGVADGDVPPDTDVGALARFVAAVLHGMSAQARDGADRAALNGIVSHAMAAWDHSR